MNKQSWLRDRMDDFLKKENPAWSHSLLLITMVIERAFANWHEKQQVTNKTMAIEERMEHLEASYDDLQAKVNKKAATDAFGRR